MYFPAPIIMVVGPSVAPDDNGYSMFSFGAVLVKLKAEVENWSLLQNVKLCVDFMIYLSKKIFF